MSEMIKFEEVEKRVITIREQQVLIDRDVAELYGVETKEVNQAVSRNPDKFPEGYIFSVTQEEYNCSRSQIVTLNELGRGHNIKYAPKAFTEKGLYMLATILKSPAATQTTLAIVETFAKIREMSRAINQLPNVQE
ncbi:MAG: ORF6N domain-containing protein, partial [Oscillospiraceae bacterium]|nr:ORF6N domain-containing protein [Oscillospiraceae bacterium]